MLASSVMTPVMAAVDDVVELLAGLGCGGASGAQSDWPWTVAPALRVSPRLGLHKH